MKTISELQQEVRSIQKGLQLLDNRLKALDDEMVNFKEGPKENSLYQKVYELAKGMPVIRHPLMLENQAAKNNYIAILIMVATLEDSINENQLLFLQRIIMDDLYNKRLSYYVRQLVKITPENVVYNCDETVKKKLAEQLLLDLLIIANLSRIKTKRTFDLIAQIVAFLGIAKEVVGHTSVIAAIVLMQKIDSYSYLNNKQSVEYGIAEVDNEKFGYYLTEISGWNDIVNKALQEKTSATKLNNKRKSNIFDEEEERCIQRIRNFSQAPSKQLYDLGWFFEQDSYLCKAKECYRMAKEFGNDKASSRLNYLESIM